MQALSAPASAPGTLPAARQRPLLLAPAVITPPHERTAAVAASRSRRAAAAAAVPSPQRPSLPRHPLAGLHPSLLLDAACAACCVALLASAAARRHTSFSSSSSPLTQQQQQQQQQQRTALSSSSAGGSQLASADSGRLGSAPQVPCTIVQAPTAPSPPLAAAAAAAAGYAPGWAGEAMAACCLLMAASNAWFKRSGARRAAAQGGASTEAAARLVRLESLTEQQLTEFGAAVRQIDKLQLRTRLTSGDIRRPIAQLQSASGEQSAVLVRLVSEQEALRGQLREQQALLAALQGLTAKQFKVTVEAIKQLRAAQAQQQTPAPTPTPTPTQAGK